MVRYMTYVTLLAFALMAVTCSVSANPDPADVAAEASVESSPAHVIETEEEATNTKSPVNNAGAISDSISKVTVETAINTPTSKSSSRSSGPDDSASSPGTAPDASASTHVTPSIALASVAAIVIINLFV
ncbi:unnamed protein product [Peronospora destructor]|uniref:Uncharacterized protein n=1 Tax=Peronospora destructor TaxID=86335 RepID=A0AAV0TAI1_9STRA|nr:unnamed protein product [Peronospora destructor]